MIADQIIIMLTLNLQDVLKLTQTDVPSTVNIAATQCVTQTVHLKCVSCKPFN